MVSLPHLPHCTGTNSRFCWTLQYFCILQGQVLSSSPSDKLSSFSSYIGFASWQLLASPHSRKVVREIFLAFHWTLKWNNTITEPTTSTQARTRIARMGVGTLNQSTSQGWLNPSLYQMIIIIIAVAYEPYTHIAKLYLPLMFSYSINLLTWSIV